MRGRCYRSPNEPVPENGTPHRQAFFSNGLFGAGLQLFTNRGAMEETDADADESKRIEGAGPAQSVWPRVSPWRRFPSLRQPCCRYSPRWRPQRGQQQDCCGNAAGASLLRRRKGPRSDRESEPALIGGEHAREQLRRANRQLMQAEAQAASADDRRKIEGAAAGDLPLAEQALNAADRPSNARVHVDLSSLDQLSVQLKDLKLPDEAALRLQMDKQLKVMEKLQVQLNSPEWKAQMQRLQTQSMQAAQAQMNSPEFKAQMEQARTLDRAKIDAMLADGAQAAGQGHGADPLRRDAAADRPGHADGAHGTRTDAVALRISIALRISVARDHTRSAAQKASAD